MPGITDIEARIAALNKLPDSAEKAEGLLDTSFAALDVDIRRANQCARAAWDVCRKTKDIVGQIKALVLQGRIQTILNRPQVALGHLYKALEFTDKVEDTRSFAAVQSGLGHAYVSLNEYQRALEHFVKAQDACESCDDIRGLVQSKIGIGQVCALSGNVVTALEHLQTAMATARQHNLMREQKDVFIRSTEACLLDGRWAQAIEYAEVGLGNCDPEDVKSLLILHSRVARAHQKDGNLTAAWEHANKALELSREIKRSPERAKATVVLADIARENGDLYQERSLLKAASELCSDMNLLELGSQVWESLADSFEASDEYPQAVEALRMARQWYSKFRDESENQHVLNVRAVLEVDLLKQLAESHHVRYVELAKALEELQDANDHLSSINEQKDSILEIVAHDLKNPLGSILSSGQLLSLGFAELSEPERAKLLGDIVDQSTNMLAMIRELLSVDAIEDIKLKKLHAVDIVSVATSVYNNNVLAAQKKDINFELHCGEQELTILGVRRLLIQIVDNLVTNAIKFCSSNDSVILSVERAHDSVLIHVRDTGPGISSEEMDRLYIKGETLGAKPTGGEESSGLGLSIVKKLVDDFSGTIQCQSTLGQGCLFTLQFQIESGE